MLQLIFPAQEFFDNETQLFSETEEVTLTFEHSLVTVSKWESKFEKPFMAKKEKTTSETLDYLECMITTPGDYTQVMLGLTDAQVDTINNYINSKQTATTFGDLPDRNGFQETITAELIYYWLVAFNIPFECQYWHINRLFALIRTCNNKQEKQNPKKQGRHEAAAQRAKINAERRAAYNTSG